jgi:hypothetical protein
MLGLQISLSIAVILLAVVSYFCFKFALTLLRVQEAVEASLDVIDEKHETITEILSRPLFFDSPEVRRVLIDIEATKRALHAVAYSLSQNFEEADNKEKTE